MRALADEVREGRLELEGVVEAAFVEGLRDDPERTAPWHAFADGVWVYDGRVPLDMHVVDGTAVLWLSDDRDERAYGLLESDRPSVVRWAESLYEEYRAEAEPLDPVRLPGD